MRYTEGQKMKATTNKKKKKKKTQTGTSSDAWNKASNISAEDVQ